MMEFAFPVWDQMAALSKERFFSALYHFICDFKKKCQFHSLEIRSLLTSFKCWGGGREGGREGGNRDEKSQMNQKSRVRSHSSDKRKTHLNYPVGVVKV